MNETTYNPNITPYPYQNPAMMQQDQEPQQAPTYQPQPEPALQQPEQPTEFQQAEPPKPYTLKRLQSRDVFPMLRILSKIGVSQLKDCFSSPEVTKAISKATESGKDVDLSAVGVNVAFDMAGIIVDNLPKCEQDIYLFLSQLSGLKPQQIAEMDAIVFFEMIVDVIKKPEFKDFLKVVSRSLK